MNHRFFLKVKVTVIVWHSIETLKKTHATIAVGSWEKNSFHFTSFLCSSSKIPTNENATLKFYLSIEKSNMGGRSGMEGAKRAPDAPAIEERCRNCIPVGTCSCHTDILAPQIWESNMQQIQHIWARGQKRAVDMAAAAALAPLYGGEKNGPKIECFWSKTCWKWPIK